jgi:hypothetical protein
MNSRKLIKEHKKLLLELSEVELELAALKLRKLLDQNRFPEWVADSWVDSNKKKAVPLKNGYWLRTYFVMSPTTGDLTPDMMWYSGRMCDENGKVVGGIVTVNIYDPDEVDMNIWKDLVTFSEAYKKSEDALIHNRVSIDKEIERLSGMLQQGQTSTGRLEKMGEEGGGGGF